MIYHIAHKTDWENALKKGMYTCPSIALEGFIHASYREQVLISLQRYFAPTDSVVLLEIDETKLTTKLVVEKAEHNQQNYPHIYGTLPVNEVTKVIDIVGDFKQFNF